MLQHLSGTDVTEQRLIDKIHGQIPELADSRLTDFEKVCLLRDWVARTIPGSVSNEDALDNKEGSPFYTFDVPTLFDAFGKRFGGIRCGGTAYALAKLYRSFGFEALIYNGGICAAFATHCVTLVRINYGRTSLLCVQDAWFNMTFLTTNAGPLDFFELLSLLQARQHDKVTLEFDPLGFSRDFYEGSKIFRTQFSLPLWLDEYGSRYLLALEEHGFPRHLLYLFVFPIGVWAPTRAAAMLLRSQIAGTLRCDPRYIDLNYGKE
jgi:hypothetical protein